MAAPRHFPLLTARASFTFIVLLSTALLSGCALPTNSIVLENKPAEPRLSGSTRDIPQEWEGRLFRITSGPVSLGGAASHTHGFSNIAQGYSGPASAGFKPLGLKSDAASSSHVHQLISQSQDTSVTGAASNLPPSQILLALLVTSSHRRPIEGQIVAYVGKGVPEGWMLCDGENGTPAMQGRYVVLSRGANVPGTAGADTHVHDASHKDSWGVAATDGTVGTNRARHLDYFPSAKPNLVASPLGHTHRAEEPAPAVAQTSVESVRPPTVEVVYLQATAAAKSMPVDAIIPFAGDSAPMGWKFWSAIGDMPVEGRFLAGSATSNSGRLFGAESHTHTVTATHHVILYPDVAGQPEDVADKGPPVATADHTHTADISETFTTAPASHIPPYVSMRFIIKE